MVKPFNKILICLLFFISCFSQAQINLVPNPSFEDTIACPTNQDQVSNATGWQNYSNESPDYFNACDQTHGFGVPNNWGGFQPAASGNAYCALSAFFPSIPNGREIIGRNLVSNLIIGTKYFISLKVNLSIDTFMSSSYACNKLGVRFSTVSYNTTNPSPINDSAHVYSNTIISDTVNWVTIFGSFISDSSYSNISIGNFFLDSSTDTLKISKPTPYVFAYYYIDDICVSTDSIFTKNYAWTGIEEYNNTQQKIVLYPNPSHNGIFYSSTVLVNEYIQVFDVLGNSLKKFYINGNVIDLSYLQDGIYIITMTNQQSCLSKKIIINS